VPHNYVGLFWFGVYQNLQRFEEMAFFRIMVAALWYAIWVAFTSKDAPEQLGKTFISSCFMG